jgi:multicomponent Na+:H+ antiporter subunit A
MGNTTLHQPHGITFRMDLCCVLIPATVFIAFFLALLSVPLPWRLTWPWIPSLDINLAIFIDGLSAQFILLISGIGTLVFVYATGYLAGDSRRHRVFLLLLLFMAAMLGAVASDHLIVMFVFWELTSVLSFLLVGFNHENEVGRKSAQQALLITGFGGLCLLAGIILLGSISGTYSMEAIIAGAPDFSTEPRLKAALIFVFLGAFTKSAQFPFHFWLPNAMAAPTPVSAYLHSATMVKLGIYLLARLDAAFSDILFWEYALIGTGTLTAVFAAAQTVLERDLKRILAWSTIATLGTLVMLVGLPGKGAALAACTLFFAHALYKAPLFFVVGNLDHGAGTREIDKLTGMRHHMPWTAALALLASVSMAGLPLTFGFIAKDAITLAKAQAGALDLVSYATMFINGVSVAVAAIAAIRIFWGVDTALPAAAPHEAPVSMLLPPFMLVALGIIFGIKPTLVDPVLGSAVLAIAPGFDPDTVNTAYDIVPVLEALLGSLLFGWLIYRYWDRLHQLFHRGPHVINFGPQAWYQSILGALPILAARQTRFLQHGILPRYLMTLTGITTLLMMMLILVARPSWTWPNAGSLTVPVLGASLLISAGAITALFVRNHLVLLLVSGLVGYGSAILFLFTGAPDLAFTQFAVETVFVVVAAAVLLRLRRLPQKPAAPSGGLWTKLFPLLLATAFGTTMAVMLLLVSVSPLDQQLTTFFAEQSLPAARGRNVVNVIIVDFRALDTLGEIAVLAFAFLAALPLLMALKRRLP